MNNFKLYLFLVIAFLPSLLFAQDKKVTDLIKKASALIDAGKYDSAIIYTDKAIELSPQESWAYLIKGLAYYGNNDYNNAIENYNQAIHFSSEYSAAYQNRGLAYYTRNSGEDSTLAELDFLKVIELDPKNATAYNYIGLSSYREKKYDQAIDYFGFAIRADHKYVNAYYNRGLAYNKKENYDKAIDDYNKAIELNPQYASAYNNRGIAYYNKGDYEKAMADYNKVIESDPKYSYAYNNRGLVYDNKENYEKAIAEYDTAIALNPKYSNAYNNRGLAYYNRKNYDQAMADYNKAIDLDPENIDAYLNRAGAYYNKGDYDQAITDFNQIIKSDPQNSTAYNNRGGAYQYKGNYDQAIADFKYSLSIEPLYSYALLNISACYIREQNFQQASFYYNKYKINNLKGYLEEKGWEYYKSYLDAATSYVIHNDYNKALDMLKTAEISYNNNTINKTDVDVNAVKSYADILALKGYILEKMNQPDDAKNAYNQALIIYSTQPDVIAALERIAPKQSATVAEKKTEIPINNNNKPINNNKPANNNKQLDLPVIAGKSGSPNYYAILIAEQKYSDNTIKGLSKPVSDALALKHELENDYTFSPSHIDTLFNRSREDILVTITQKCNTLTKNDNLLIFYAGHGTAEMDSYNNVKGYLVPSSAKNGNKFTYISSNDIAMALGNRSNVRHILFISDACFSGALMSRDLENSPKDVQLAYENPSRRVMTSGNKEDVPDNSVFFYYLLDKLKSNKEKYLLADNLFNAIKPAVVNNSRGLPLHEVIYDTGDQGGDFVFIKK